VVVLFVVPEVPVTVIAYVPGAALVLTAMLSVALPAPVILPAELKLAVTPAGSVEVVSVTAELNPPITATEIVELPMPPSTTETALGEADKL
jgi:hypothetical protein